MGEGKKKREKSKKSVDKAGMFWYSNQALERRVLETGKCGWENAAALKKVLDKRESVRYNNRVRLSGKRCWTEGWKEKLPKLLKKVLDKLNSLW